MQNKSVNTNTWISNKVEIQNKSANSNNWTSNKSRNAIAIILMTKHLLICTFIFLLVQNPFEIVE